MLKVVPLLRRKVMRKLPVWLLLVVAVTVGVGAQWTRDQVLSFTGTTGGEPVTFVSPLMIDANSVEPCGNLSGFTAPCQPHLISVVGGAVNVNLPGVVASWSVDTETTGPSPTTIGLTPAGSAGCPATANPVIPKAPTTPGAISGGSWDYCLYYSQVPTSSPLDSLKITWSQP